MPTLIHEVLNTVRRTLRPTEPVHFHAGDDGRPSICENARCSSPALAVAHD
jgi:hypothetical protein